MTIAVAVPVPACHILPPVIHGVSKARALKIVYFDFDSCPTWKRRGVRSRIATGTNHASHENCKLFTTMSGIQLSGLASGLDWQSIVTKLMAASAIPQTNLKTEVTHNTQKTSTLTSISTALTNLQDSIQVLSGGTNSVFAQRSAALSDTSTGWSASAASGATIGTHTIQVTQLATQAQLTGAASQGAALSSTSNVSGLTVAMLPITTAISAGQFTVNGARVTVAATDSLQDVFNNISTATGGSVTASYNPSTDKVTLSSSGAIMLGSANDSSNLLTAFGLINNGTGTISSQEALGVINNTAAISSANLKTPVTAVDGSGNGSFTINGITISYNTNTDSVAAVLGRINNSGTGVTAAYDSLNNRYTLTNTTTGDSGISVSEVSGGLLSALGLGSPATLTRGKNAQFSVDGSPALTSASNTLGASATGITGLTVTAASTETQTVSVAADSSSLSTNIQSFITNFNAVEDLIGQQTKITQNSDGTVTAATLAGNHDVQDIGSQLRSIVFAAVPGLTGAVQRLNDIGIDFNSGTNDLAITNTAAFTNALTNNPNDVATLFSDSANGIATKLNSYLLQATGATGVITTQESTINTENDNLNTQIATMQRFLDAQQAQLTAGFVAMETAQAAMQSQLAAMNAALGLNTSSSSGSSSSSSSGPSIAHATTS